MTRHHRQLIPAQEGIEHLIDLIGRAARERGIDADTRRRYTMWTVRFVWHVVGRGASALRAEQINSFLAALEPVMQESDEKTRLSVRAQAMDALAFFFGAVVPKLPRRGRNLLATEQVRRAGVDLSYAYYNRPSAPTTELNLDHWQGARQERAPVPSKRDQRREVRLGDLQSRN